MKDYRVTWEIDVLADSPQEAARIAQHKQQTTRPEYWCGLFEVRERVRHETGIDTFENVTEVDLDPSGKVDLSQEAYEATMDHLKDQADRAMEEPTT